MPRVTFVKKARKDYPQADIKKGDSYYWWAFMQGGRGGPKRFSKTRPKPSQLTQSDFWSAVYSLQESYPNTPDFEYLETIRDEISGELSNIKDETESKLDNMPDGLKEGDSGQMLQERIYELESKIDELDSVDLSIDYGLEIEDMEDGDEKDEAKKEAEEERAREIWDEIVECMELGCP